MVTVPFAADPELALARDLLSDMTRSIYHVNRLSTAR